MPHEDLHRSIMDGGSKKYRRRRKHQGADWTPERQSADSQDGFWCKSCRMWHGAMSKILSVSYEKRGGVWYILWTCTRSGNVIKDQGLVRRQ